MTEKRFIPYQNGLKFWIISDNIEKDIVPIPPIPMFIGFDSVETAEYVCELLNENEQLKQRINELEK